MARHFGDGWRCAVCGQSHRALATVFGPHMPEAWRRATAAEREDGLIGQDLCTITLADGTHHFVRGHLEIPVDDPQLDPFVWSVWVELPADAMTQVVEHWADPERESLPAFRGKLATDLPYKDPTLGMGVTLVTRGIGEVPMVRLDPRFDHVLVHEQYEGITAGRVAEINHTVLE